MFAFAFASVFAIGLVACVKTEPQSMASTLPRASSPNVEAARELDREGVRAFASARYRDAIEYFREAHRLGGPPSELWNVSRCHERLDEAELAAKVIDEYLAQQGLHTDERSEAQRELTALRSRVSMLTIATTPTGAALIIDGQAAGASPITTELAPGAHTVIARRDGYQMQTTKVEARFGRAILLELDLVKAAR